jgi:hypothetical protein
MYDEVRRPNYILKELDSLRELIDDNRQLVEEDPEELALQLNLMSLKSREKFLLDELHESNRRLSIDTFDLDIGGESVKYHRIYSNVLGDLLVGFQGLINSISHSIVKGPSESHGPIPESIVTGSRVVVRATCGGSFRVILSSDHPALIESATKTALRRLNALLDCEDNKDMIKKEIKELGPRTISSYKKFLEAIYKSKSEIKLYDMLKPEEFDTKVVTSELAEKIWKVIDKEDSIPDKEEDYRGVIKALSLIKYNFQFIISDSGAVISGGFDPSLSDKMKHYLDRLATAHFKISTKQNETTEKMDLHYDLMRFIE